MFLSNDAVIDNGRVSSASKMTVFITEIDFEIYSMFYSWDKFEIDTTNNSGIPSWPLTEPHLFQPVEQILYINAFHLENYCGVKLPLDLISYLWGKTPEYYSPCENPAKMDSLWTILQEKLTFAIENGDLEHINDEKYNPYNK